ncbi:MAG: sugar phosphate isomerase/epimerase family protein [Planctomycetota bacterium]|nr:sugar phosphate isomerase/epimerase family protein [Planctomycetota bacterium]
MSMLKRLGVCSWSLQAQSPADLALRIRNVGVSLVQIHLDPVREGGVWRADQTVGRLKDKGIRIASGMMSTKGEDYSTLESIAKTGGIRPDETWADNLRAAEGNAIMAARMGLPLVTFHAGFLPHEEGNAERIKMVERLRNLAEIFAARNVRVGLETGQESAATLLRVLNEVNATLPARAQIGVNFDPANMILYGMGDPLEALRVLSGYILQVHMKDAVPTKTKGTWGEEMPAGKGAVPWKEFLAAVERYAPDVDVMIERESGDARVADAAAARAIVAEYSGVPVGAGV